MDLFTIQRPEIGLSELAKLSGMNKATTLRMVRELESVGFVEQLAQTKAYRLGPGVLRLATLREASVPLQKVARPILKDLARETGETAHLGLFRSDELVPLMHAYSSRHATQVVMDDIDLLDFHATGSGLAYLAFAPEAFVQSVLAKPLHKFTEHTITDPDQLSERLREVRIKGFAESIGGVEADVHSVSTPFFERSGAPIGSITVAAPISRMSEDALELIRGLVVQAGKDLTNGLGGIAPEIKGHAA